MEPVIAMTATVQAPKAEIMSENGDPSIGKERVTSLLDMHKEQLDIARDVEYQVMKVLYDLRGQQTIEEMTLWTGWSRQTIYNKWSKHGFEVK